MSTTTRFPVRSIERIDAFVRAEAATVLTAAFLDDPVFTWMEPDRAARADTLPVLFDAFLAAQARHRTADLARVDGPAAGVALWVPPGVAAVHADDEPELEARLGVLGPAALARMGACSEAFAAVHPAEPAWYLNFLAVAPSHQGRGIGSALLRSVLAQCDVGGEAAYLEATSERNRALYERHGFRLIREIPLPDGGPTSYAMWRDPIMPPGHAWPQQR
ncbi:GNAT family N-acetyltransferase [Iamia sp. SCSIO 61187]|uniref:GNAT family N-acetyltransferase n=1 Tax=Iamia sp. SCSIO 61187 TaxID=2722752 RepID=UPI001C626A9A|nr:N-acetyltransferase [Iamia sp. SCSIO 61187]QYG93258.1 GNAT family N-acetyltransferase [Iamia sp. SCSIO 61187]